MRHWLIYFENLHFATKSICVLHAILECTSVFSIIVRINTDYILIGIN